MGVSVHWPLSVLCVFVCMCLYLCVCLCDTKKVTKIWNIEHQQKNYEQKHFGATIKNLNCEILTKILVTFKRWDGVKYKKLWGLTD